MHSSLILLKVLDEEVVETMIIQSLKHQKSYEKFAIEQEGGK